jgi:hypothetical protein
MKIAISALVLLAVIVGSGIRAAEAKVNCDQVRRYLKTGRSAEEISENMVIDLKEVKKCQETGDSQPDATPTPGK